MSAQSPWLPSLRRHPGLVETAKPMHRCKARSARCESALAPRPAEETEAGEVTQTLRLPLSVENIIGYLVLKVSVFIEDEDTATLQRDRLGFRSASDVHRVTFSVTVRVARSVDC